MSSSSSSVSSTDTSGVTRMSGSSLVSGLDTDSLVKSMLSSIQTKIDKQNQKQQVLEWKQEIYRDIIGDITDFQDKYLDILGDQSLRTSEAFTAMKTTSTNAAVSITDDTGTEKSYSVQVAQLATASSLRSAKASSGEIKLAYDESFFTDEKTSATISVTLDGIKKDITVNSTDEDKLASFSAGIKKAFGSSISIDENGVLSTGAGQRVSLSGDTALFGVTDGASTSLNMSSKLSDAAFANGLTADADGNYSLTINGESFTFTADQTVNEVLSTVNASDLGVTLSYNSYSDSFALTSKSTGKGFDLDVSGSLADAMFGDDAVLSAGQNAVVNISGTMIERTTNSFSYNGATISVSAVTGNYEKDANGNYATATNGTFTTQGSALDNAAVVSSTKDTDKIKSLITSFVNDYNTLIEKLNTYTHETPTYRDYDPLTDDQRDEMTEDQIEKWEKKAKEGLLRNDSDVSTFLSSMRSTFSSPNASGNLLSTFGIDTSSDLDDYGKLVIDDDALEDAINNNLGDLTSLFTGTDGLANKLNTIAKNTVNTSSASPGSLVSLAGVAGTTSESNNSIQDKLDSISDRLEQLQDMYDLRQQRYWNQFTTMETMLSNMSSTSSWLTNMFSS